MFLIFSEIVWIVAEGVGGQTSIISCMAVNPAQPGIYAAGSYGKTGKNFSLFTLFQTLY